MTWKSTPKKLF